MRRLKNILIALDQLVYVLLTLGHGSPDETLSAASYRLELQGRWSGRVLRPLVDRLFWFDPEHCKTSYLSEQQRAQLPSHYRASR
jgi:hypothetical protein